MLGLNFGRRGKRSKRKRGAASIDGELTDPDAIVRLFERVRDARSALNIGGVGKKSSQPSALLDIDAGAGHLFVDELRDQELAVDSSVEVRTWLDGIEILFESRVRRYDPVEHLYRLEIPELVDRRQRRAAHRAPVSRDVDVTASLTIGETECVGHVRDLSAGGMALTLADGADWPGCDGPVTCAIHLKEDATIECSFEVRRATSRGKITVLAGRFDGLEFKNAIALERFIADLEREALRKRAR